MCSKVLREITCPFPNFNCKTVQIWKLISNFIPHIIMGVIIYPCWGWTMLVKDDPVAFLCPHCLYTPLWKSNRNFFSTQFFYHSFFVLCSSFYTWYMWGGKYQFCKFLLDFDHWLYLSDILKKVTGSKPDVALVWFMQWAKMEFEHGEKYRYWCIVIV